MKRNIISFVFAVVSASLITVGCSKDVSFEDPSEVRLSFTYPGLTKASDSGFDAGDKVGVYITGYEDGKPSILQLGGNFASNVSASFDGTAWTLSPKLYWEEGAMYDIFAYYPYMDISSVEEQSFSVALDQNQGATAQQMSTYEASDFLWAKKAKVEQTATVPLVFRHKMSKVQVTVLKGEEFEGDIPQNLELYIHNTVPSAKIDLSTGDVIKDPHGSVASIKMKKVSTDTFEAIVVPQRIIYRVPMFEVMSNDVSYLFETKFIFSQGVCHKVSITLNNNPDQVKIDIGGQIEGWN